MTVHQYVQHDWPPEVWTVMLLVLATLVVAGLCLFLFAATRPKDVHHSDTQHPGNA